MKLVTAGLTACLLAGCTIKVDSEKSAATTTAPKVTAATATTQPRVMDSHEVYISHVRTNTSLLYKVDVPWMTDYADMICEFFRNGGTSEVLASVLWRVGTQNNLTQTDMQELAWAAGAAVTDLCPQYSYR